MLGTVDTIDAVLEALDLLPAQTPVVLDPVMVSESGAVLLAPDTRRRLVARLLPRATVVTPNLAEAREIVALATWRGETEDPHTRDPDTPELPDRVQLDDAHELARAIHRLGPSNVVVTGGHRESAGDVFFDGAAIHEISGERFAEGAAHGSGCTHSSVLAARLARGDDPLEAAHVAKRMAARAVANGLRGIGAGSGPVDVLGTRPE
jgi:hydroxymethylpyrimidine/phosphomethylpyrimidine kinase